VFVTDPQTIEIGKDFFKNKTVFVPIGAVKKGNPAGLNFPWSWHLEPGSVRFVENSPELFDAHPNQIELELSQWISTVGSYGPWGSRIVKIGKQESVAINAIIRKVDASIHPGNYVVSWLSPASPYQFTKLFSSLSLPKGAKLGVEAVVDSSYDYILNGRTVIRIKDIINKRLTRVRLSRGMIKNRKRSAPR
jgi:hypothetical protein